MASPLHYFPVGTLSGTLFIWSLSAFYAFFSLFRIGFQLAISGSNYFMIKDRTGKNRPKVLDQYGTNHIVHLKKQNIKIHYVSNGRTDKQLMLFVHGFPECWFAWRHQMKAFDKDYHVVSMSLRGYGDSDAPKGIANYAVKELITDIAELIETLVTKEHPKCILVGHDWGGILTWAVAHASGALISKHIVMNAPHVIDWIEEIENSFIQFIRSWYKIFFNFPIVPELIIRANDFKVIEGIFKKHSKSMEEVDAYKYCLSANPYSMTGALNFYRANLAGFTEIAVKEFRMRQTKIEPETVIIWAKDDKYLGANLAELSGKRCRQVTIEYIDNCSHFLQVEQPEKVNSLMKKHLP